MNQIVLGDNLDVLGDLPDGSADLVYVDAPLNTERTQSRTRIRTTQSKNGHRIGFQGRRYETSTAPRGRIRDPEVGLLASFAGTPRVFLLAWFVATACDQPADTGLPGAAHFLARDSAGVVVATTSGAQARAPVGWMVDAVPVYQIGMAEGEEPHLFTRIQGAEQLSDGRVVVLDMASCELRFFGPDAGFLQRGVYKRKLNRRFVASVGPASLAAAISTPAGPMSLENRVARSLSPGGGGRVLRAGRAFAGRLVTRVVGGIVAGIAGWLISDLTLGRVEEWRGRTELEQGLTDLVNAEKAKVKSALSEAVDGVKFGALG